MNKSKAATDGAEPEGITEPATVTLEDDTGPARSNVPRTTQVASTAIVGDFSLPNEHIDYAILLENGLNTRIHGLQAHIAAIETLLKKGQAKHDEIIADLVHRHESEKMKLENQLDNLKTALRMAKSGVAAKDVPT